MPAQHQPPSLTHILLPPAAAKECAHVGDMRQLAAPNFKLSALTMEKSECIDSDSLLQLYPGKAVQGSSSGQVPWLEG